MSRSTSATEALHTSGYRLTMQRQLVWDTLRQSKKHLSAEDILSQIRKHYPRFNLATVYRSLEVLEELGLVKETRIRDRAYYELAEEGMDHYHLVCAQWGSTFLIS